MTGKGGTNANTLQRLASAQHNTLTETQSQLPDSNPQVKGAGKNDRSSEPGFKWPQSSVEERPLWLLGVSVKLLTEHCGFKLKHWFSII